MKRVFYTSFTVAGTMVGAFIAWSWVVGCAWLDSQICMTPFNSGLYWPVTKGMAAVILVFGSIAFLTRKYADR